MLKVLVWNCRGAASKGFAAVLRDTKRRYRLDMVVILEPRVSGNVASNVIKNWGFKYSIRREAVGFSGGIWILWNLDDLKVDVRAMNDQFIHCKLFARDESMLFTAVYAYPNPQRRNMIWGELESIAGEVAEPWLLVGDFNEIRSPLEQRGGGRINEVRCKKFNDWIEGCSLMDMEASGPFFTWKGPKWDGLERVFKRLDRCLCNVLWHEKFGEAVVRVIPKICSDHHPLLVCTAKDNREFRKRQFRFEAAWQMHEGFEEVLRNSWKGKEATHEKLTTLQQDLMGWNKEIFGKIEGRKRRILNRLDGKYGRGKNLSEECVALKSDSVLWKALANVWPTVVTNTCWEIGNGEGVRFWEDRWLEDGSRLRDRDENGWR
ncbi:hypothetical protein K1719_033730 [Acacia pycnantha]|nr:hypothetical protein K1719_033730 [Acacia pycnantha]